MEPSSAPRIPQSVGIIMDGNRRWAKERGMPTVEGHRAGYNTLKDVCRWAHSAGVSYLTVFAFSTENWNRVEEEVKFLMELIRFAFNNDLENFKKENIRLRYAGDLSRFSKDIQDIFSNAMEQTKDNTGLTLTTCLSYGGRNEILRGMKKAAAELSKEDFMKMTEVDFARYIDTPAMSDPDMIIRTSGEQRLSGFLAWQGVYSELFFTDTKWPDFSQEEFLKLIAEYGERDRRHGK